LQARLVEEAERLAAQQRAAADAHEAAAATLRAVQEDIDEETEWLKARCCCMMRCSWHQSMLLQVPHMHKLFEVVQQGP
jgi:Tfp pilus assembly protein PilX